MLVINRKPGESIRVLNQDNNQEHKLTFLGNSSPVSRYMLNGSRITKPEKACFYLDDDALVMVIVVSAGDNARLAVDAKGNFKVMRDEMGSDPYIKNDFK